MTILKKTMTINENNTSVNSIESEARRRNYLPSSFMDTIDEDILDE